MNPFTIRKIIILTCLLTAGIFLSLGIKMTSTKISNRILRAATAHKSSARSLDTRRIHSASDALLLMNLYSPIIDVDNDGNYVPGLASKFYWRNGSLHIEFKRGFRSVDGKPVGAADALFSLKRLILDKNNTHGDTARILCPNWDGKKISDECPGLKIIEDTLIITPVEEYLGKILIPLLSSPDHRIIPENSVDPLSLEITDFRNTSGAYYVDKDSSDGKIVLRANMTSQLYSEDMPQLIQMVPYDYNSIVDLVREDKIDIIGPDFSYMPKMLNNLFEDHNDFTIFATEPIKVSTIFFNLKAMHDFTPEERAYAAFKFVENRRKQNIVNYGSQNTMQFFQFASAGSLTTDQLEQIEKMRLDAADYGQKFHPKRKMEFLASKSLIKNWGNFFDINSYFEPYLLDKGYLSYAPEDRPGDVFSGVTDVAFDTDYSLLSYNFSQLNFGLSAHEGKMWLDAFIKEKSPERSLALVNELHFSFLKKVAMYPHSVSPYTVIHKKDIRVEMTRLSATYNLWQVKMN
ncbi:periplasmic substrate-binding domain-containing protein [Bdellovibrio reynosensis]|uniref:Solute-binding protein family 5 domain-containing protein n=1 Tax=Bdellovibrio reynosensis TaxID=2835041 RepID=A0ABY4C951_9BACT|nr:hypothetical protein [Bdellovibrio reynosensis]UOF00422.1 hypothetical protein MNR06_12010 [Bdellovibrio reynosensis]